MQLILGLANCGWTHIWPNSYKVGYNPLCPKLGGNPCGRVRGVYMHPDL